MDFHKSTRTLHICKKEGHTRLSIIFASVITILFLILLPYSQSHGQQNLGSLQVDIKSWTGERIDYHGISLKIYREFNSEPYKIIESLSGNPNYIELPLAHKYKVETYVNSMYSGVLYVDFQKTNQRIELSIPISGSVRFTVIHNDGYTPVEGASLAIKSKDGTYKYWTNGTTDDLGKTIRFWLQPTIIDSDYYAAEITIGKNLLYTFSPVNIRPGISQEIKIMTPWPAVTDLIAVSVYKSPLQKVSQEDGNFVVQLYDENNRKVADSKVNFRGVAYFSNLKVGNYVFYVVKLDDMQNREWGNIQMTITGKQSDIEIFKNQITNGKEVSVAASKIENELVKNAISVVSNEDANESTKPIIPNWIKNVAKWWSDNKISDLEFIKSIEYMIQNKILSVGKSSSSG